MIRPIGFKLAMLASAVALSACGGGGGSSSGVMSISGVAATGAAIVDGQVNAKCSRGIGSTKTGADGSYKLEVPGAALPCVLRVEKGETILHSLIESGSSETTANITPLSELVLGQIGRGQGSAFFDRFDAADQSTLTLDAVSAAIAQLIEALRDVIVLSNADFLRGPLVAAVNGEGGNLLDQKLDVLGLALRESGLSLGQLVSALVSNPGQLPSQLAAVPTSAEHCPAVRTGDYWGLEYSDNNEIDSPDEGVYIDAVTMKARSTEPEGSTETPFELDIIPKPGEPCRFTIDETGSGDPEAIEEIAVSPGGIWVSHFREEGRLQPLIMFPKQDDIALADLAGNWNQFVWSPTQGDLSTLLRSFTVDSSGSVSDLQTRTGATEIPSSGSIQWVRRTTGAFEQMIDGQTQPGVMLPFRAPNGSLHLIGHPHDGAPGFVFMSKQAGIASPLVDRQTNSWVFGFGVAQDRPIFKHTGTIVRSDEVGYAISGVPSQGASTRVDTRLINQPWAGLTHRAQDACTDPSGSSVECSDLFVMRMEGAGIAVGLTTRPGPWLSIIVDR